MGRSRCAEAGLPTGVFIVAGLRVLTALLLKKNLTKETKEELRLLELFWYGEGIPVGLIVSILKTK